MSAADSLPLPCADHSTLDRIGLPAFTIATAAVAGALITWGIKRAAQP